MFATPWVALGYELTPDYHERTRLMGVQNFMGQLAYVVAPWFLLFMQNERIFDDMVDGAAGLAVGEAGGLGQVADVESAGGATVYRVTEASACENDWNSLAMPSGVRPCWL